MRCPDLRTKAQVTGTLETEGTDAWRGWVLMNRRCDMIDTEVDDEHPDPVIVRVRQIPR